MPAAQPANGTNRRSCGPFASIPATVRRAVKGCDWTPDWTDLQSNRDYKRQSMTGVFLVGNR